MSTTGDQSIPETDVTDEVCAAVLAAGLLLGVVDVDAVVAWADGEIDRREGVPPGWLIEVSLGKRRHVLDVIGTLKQVAGEVDGRTVFVGICSLLPDLSGYDLDRCEALARRLYRTAYDLFEADWRCDLLCEADGVADAFEWHRDGLIADTRDQVVAKFFAFVDRLRDEAVRRRLHPVRYVVGLPGHGS